MFKLDIQTVIYSVLCTCHLQGGRRLPAHLYYIHPIVFRHFTHGETIIISVNVRSFSPPFLHKTCLLILRQSDMVYWHRIVLINEIIGDQNVSRMRACRWPPLLYLRQRCNLCKNRLVTFSLLTEVLASSFIHRGRCLRWGAVERKFTVTSFHSSHL